jgi:hypothetical protein
MEWEAIGTMMLEEAMVAKPYATPTNVAQIANEYFLPLPKWRIPKMALVTKALIQFSPKIGINAPRNSTSWHIKTIHQHFLRNRSSILERRLQTIYIFTSLIPGRQATTI